MASLLDEWATVRASDTGGNPRSLSPLGAGGRGGGGGLAIGFSDEEADEATGELGADALPSFLGHRPAPVEPDIFALDPVEREVTRCVRESEGAGRQRADHFFFQPARTPALNLLPVSPQNKRRGRGAVTAIAAAGDIVLVTTARGYLLRYDIAAGGPPTEVELSRAPGGAATGLWLDASGVHAVVSMEGAAGDSETLYLHASWRKARPVSGLRVGGSGSGGSISITTTTTAAAFDDGPAVVGGGVTPTSTGEVLIGTSTGSLRSFTWGERDKADGGVAHLFDLLPGNGRGRGGGSSRGGCQPPPSPSSPSPPVRITGLAQARTADGRRTALVATPDRLFIFASPANGAGAGTRAAAGSVSLSAVFASPHASPAPADALPNCLAPAADAASTLRLDGTGALVMRSGAHGAAGATSSPDRFVWLSPAGLVSGRLALGGSGSGGGGTSAPPPAPGTPHQRSSTAHDSGGGGDAAPELALLRDVVVAPLHPPGLLGPTAGRPRVLAATAFHALLLDGSRALAVHVLSGALVQSLTPGRPSSTGGGPSTTTAAALSSSQPPAPVLPRAGLATDPVTGAAYLCTGGGEGTLFEVAASDEGRGEWRAHLARHDWARAARAAEGPAARAAVALAEADAAFTAGDRARAATLWGSTLGATHPSFEEAALRLLDAGDPASLATFLEARLAALPPADKAQATMVAAWRLELLLDDINRASLGAEAAAEGEREGGGEGGGAAPLVRSLRAFIDSHVASLDPGVTVGLLAGYGRTADLLHYARVRGDAEAVLDHLLCGGGGGGDDERGGGGGGGLQASSAATPPTAASAALAVLRSPGTPAALHYKYGPTLMAACPDAAVDAWLAVEAGGAPPLDPRRLLPALVPYGAGAGAAASSADPVGRSAALRYVRHTVEVGGCTDPALHNLAAALLIASAAAETPPPPPPTSRTGEEGGGDGGDRGEDAERELLEYLASARDAGDGAPLYDPALALRLARSAGGSAGLGVEGGAGGAPSTHPDAPQPAFPPRLRRAAVHLLCELGLAEDAVSLALTFDRGLAVAVAGSRPGAVPGAPGGGGGSGGGGDDDAVRRRLALAVVRHLIASGAAAAAAAPTPEAAASATAASIAEVDAFLRDSSHADGGGGGGGGGVGSELSSAALRLEEVLPLFPGVTAIGAFQSAVVASLAECDARVAALRSKMEAAAEVADALRGDLAALAGRAGRVSAAEPCTHCGRGVGGPPAPGAGLVAPGGALPPLYLYPTGRAYHGVCAAAAVAARSEPGSAARLKETAAALASGRGTPALVAAFDAEVGAEDPACGERAARAVELPLVALPADEREVEAWRVGV